MSSSTQSNVSQSEYWIRVNLALEICVKEALIEVVHNKQNNPTYIGLPEDGTDLYNYIVQIKHNNNHPLHRARLTNAQWDIFCPSTGQTNLQDWNITLLISVIRSVLNIKPFGGWNITAVNQNDNSIGAFVFLAREIRNALKHGTLNDITTLAQFSSYWNKIEAILKGLNYSRMNVFHQLKEEADISEESLPKDVSNVPQKWKRKAEKYLQEKTRRFSTIKSYSFINDETYKLGEGSFGEVFLGYKNTTKDWVAIKKLPHRTSHPQEVTIQHKLRSSDQNKNYIAFFHDWFTKTGYHYLIFELCEDTLVEYLQGKRNLSQLNDMTKQFLKGLFIHKHQIAHRDLKPDNLMTKTVASGKVILKICDYGVSKCFDNVQLSSQTATKYGNFYWRSPEQGFKDKFLFYNDIFVASMLMVYILTNGEHPFLKSQQGMNFTKLPWYSNPDEWFNTPLKMRADIEVDYHVIQLVEDVMERYRECIFARTSAPYDIEQIKDKYNEIYFAQCPEYTQGDRLMIHIRFDYQTTAVKKEEKKDKPTEIVKAVSRAFDGGSDVAAYTRVLEICQFKEVNKNSRYDPSQEELIFHFGSLKISADERETCRAKPFYVLVNILAHGASPVDSSQDVWLEIPSKEKKGIFLTVLLRQLKNELGPQARLIVLCNVCRKKYPGLKSGGKFPDDVLIIYSVKDDMEDESSDTMNSTEASSFCQMLLQYMTPGKRISEMLKTVTDNNGDVLCNKESIRNFIF